MNHKKINLIVQWAGLLVLVALLLKINWQEYLAILKTVHPAWLVMAALLNFLRLFIEAWRWKYLIEMQGISYSMKDAFLASLNSIYIGSITPGDIGNFLKVFYLAEDKEVSVGLSLSNTVADKLMDLLVLMGLGLWGLGTLSLRPFLFLGAVGYSILVLFFLFWLINSEKIHTAFARRFSSMGQMAKFSHSLEKNRTDFYNGLKFYSKIPALAIPVLMTFASFLCFYFLAYCLVGSIHIHISQWNIARLMAISIMVSRLIPVSFSGLGSKDLTMVMLLRNFGATTAEGVTFSLLFLFTSYLVPTVIGAASWLIKPIKIN